MKGTYLYCKFLATGFGKFLNVGHKQSRSFLVLVGHTFVYSRHECGRLWYNIWPGIENLRKCAQVIMHIHYQCLQGHNFIKCPYPLRLHYLIPSAVFNM